MLSVIITIAVVGLIVWLITTYIPMNDTFKKIIIAVAVILVVLYLLNAFGLLGAVNQIPVYRR